MIWKIGAVWIVGAALALAACTAPAGKVPAADAALKEIHVPGVATSGSRRV